MISVMDDAVPPTEKQPWEHLEGWNRTLGQMMHLYIEPEVVRRQEAGEIEKPLYLFAAQVLQPVEGPTRILLNEEVAGTGLMRASRDVEKGEQVLISDLACLERYELPDDLLDCGHFTTFRAGEGWRIFFNFLSGRAKARDMLHNASQFLEASRTSAAKEHHGPAVENMFAACELVSKAELILHRSPAVNSKTHGPIKSQINAWAKMGNINAAFVDYFNRLSEQRPNARYGDAEHRPDSPDRDAYDLVQAIIDSSLQRIGKATDHPAVLEG